MVKIREKTKKIKILENVAIIITLKHMLILVKILLERFKITEGVKYLIFLLFIFDMLWLRIIRQY